MDGIRITMDSHEPDHIAALLVELGVQVEKKPITPGDYVLSSECAVERKTVGDFFNSMFSGRLFEQAESLKNAYAKPMVILEGDVESELSRRKNPRAFWGAMLRLQVDMGVPIIATPTFLHTADSLYTLAKRLQKAKVEKIAIQHKPRLMTDREWQLYVVASLPGIGDEIAARLLKHFKTARNVFEASEKDLMKVEGIGDCKASRIRKTLDKEFR
jgi:ERCC4-type nuclease